MKITKSVRAGIRKAVDRSKEYDAATIVIHNDGSVTARKDADKTRKGADPIRYMIGWAEDIVTEDGIIREGW